MFYRFIIPSLFITSFFHGIVFGACVEQSGKCSQRFKGEKQSLRVIQEGKNVSNNDLYPMSGIKKIIIRGSDVIFYHGWEDEFDRASKENICFITDEVRPLFNRVVSMFDQEISLIKKEACMGSRRMHFYQIGLF